MSKKIAIYYIFFVFLVIALNIVYLHFQNIRYDIYFNETYKIKIENLGFYYDQIIQNILSNQGYKINVDGIDFHVRQLPINTFVIVFLIKLFNYNIFFLYIFKNIVTLSLYFFSLYFLQKKLEQKKIIILGIIAIFIPYNLHTILAIEFEDNITSILLPILFIQLIYNNNYKILIVSVILFILYLTKQNMFILVMALPLIYIFLEKKKYRFLILIGPSLAILLWGSYSYIKTDRFAFGSSLTSYAQRELNMTVFNNKFRDYYPNQSVDLIPADSIPENILNEWDVHDYYLQKNKNFIMNNPKIFLENFLIKIKFIFFNFEVLKNKADETIDFTYIKKISHFLNLIFFNLGVIIFTYKIFMLSIKKNFFQKKDFYYISIVILNLIPHLIGWATHKHLVGIGIISIIYCLLVFGDLKFSKNQY